MSCGDAWCAGGYRARRRAAERTTTGRRVRMFGVRDIMSRRIARARRAGGRELRRCGLRVDDKKRKIGIASCFMRYLCRGGASGSAAGAPVQRTVSDAALGRRIFLRHDCGAEARFRPDDPRSVRPADTLRSRRKSGGYGCSRVPRLLPLASAERGGAPVRRDDARLQDRRPHVRLCR